MSKVSNETYSRIEYIDKNGKHDWEKVSEEGLQDKVDKLTAEENQVEVKFTQTFGVHEVSDSSPLEDLAALTSNPIRQAQIINNSLRIYQMKAITDILKQDNFTPVDGVYDLADVCSTLAERKSASPEEKAARALSKLAGYEITPEALASILAAMNPSAAGA